MSSIEIEWQVGGVRDGPAFHSKRSFITWHKRTSTHAIVQ